MSDFTRRAVSKQWQRRRTPPKITTLALLQPSSGEQVITLNTTHFDRTRDTNSYELSNTYLRFVYDFHVQSHTFKREKKSPFLISSVQILKLCIIKVWRARKFTSYFFLLFSKQASIHNSHAGTFRGRWGGGRGERRRWSFDWSTFGFGRLQHWLMCGSYHNRKSGEAIP